MANIYTDIQEIIRHNFQFLKDYGFSDFEEEQLAFELHFIAKNSFVKIDIWLEAISSSPIWVTVNGLFINHLELENPELKNYSKALKDNYDALFQQYLKTNDKNFLVQLSDMYSKVGKQINEAYLKEISEIFQRHSEVLNGNLEVLKNNNKNFRK